MKSNRRVHTFTQSSPKQRQILFARDHQTRGTQRQATPCRCPCGTSGPGRSGLGTLMVPEGRVGTGAARVQRREGPSKPTLGSGSLTDATGG